MPESKWQPVMVITSKRLECQCGSLAIFVRLEAVEDEEFDYEYWCQHCWEKAIDEQDA